MGLRPSLFGILTISLTMATSSVLAGPNCTCRYKGVDIPEGQTICMQLPSGNVLATCGRVLNNTSWKTLQKECPYGALPLSKQNTEVSAS